MTDINEELNNILNSLMATATVDGEHVYYSSDHQDQAIAKIKALVVEELPHDRASKSRL